MNPDGETVRIVHISDLHIDLFVFVSYLTNDGSIKKVLKPSATYLSVAAKECQKKESNLLVTGAHWRAATFPRELCNHLSTLSKAKCTDRMKD